MANTWTALITAVVPQMDSNVITATVQYTGVDSISGAQVGQYSKNYIFNSANANEAASFQGNIQTELNGIPILEFAQIALTGLVGTTLTPASFSSGNIITVASIADQYWQTIMKPALKLAAIEFIQGNPTCAETDVIPGIATTLNSQVSTLIGQYVNNAYNLGYIPVADFAHFTAWVCTLTPTQIMEM